MRTLSLKRSARCGHVWLPDIDASMYDGLTEYMKVVVNNIWSGRCPICGSVAITSEGRPALGTNALPDVR